jgi:hypothetical protein
VELRTDYLHHVKSTPGTDYSFNTVTRLRAGLPENHGSIPDTGRDVSLSTTFRLAPRLPCFLSNYYPRVVKLGHEAEPSPLPSAKVKNTSALYAFSRSCTVLSTGRVLPVVTSMQLHFIREGHHVNRNIFREGSDKFRY